jgi:hypothetical protein
MKPFTERRKRIAKALPLRYEILLIGAGEPVPLPEASDQTYPFRAHSEYYYLTGIDRPGGVLAFDPRQPFSKREVSFVPDLTAAERIWEGRTEVVGTSLSRLEAWLGSRRDRPIVNVGARSHVSAERTLETTRLVGYIILFAALAFSPDRTRMYAVYARTRFPQLG